MKVLLSTGAIAGIVVAGVVVLIIVAIIGWWISTMNRIRKLQVSIEDALSGIDVALTKRFDLLTEQLQVTKGYMKHEKETLALVTEMRTGHNSGNRSVEELQKFSDNIQKVANAVNFAFEQYPDLKAIESTRVLQASVTDAEEHLQAARRLYNSNVSTYNKTIVVFPNTIVARHIKAEKAQFFKAEEAKKADVNLQF